MKGNRIVVSAGGTAQSNNGDGKVHLSPQSKIASYCRFIVSSTVLLYGLDTKPKGIKRNNLWFLTGLGSDLRFGAYPLLEIHSLLSLSSAASQSNSAFHL